MFLKISQALELYGSVFKEVTLHYVDEIDPLHIVKNSTKAMLQDLDPYSEVLENNEGDDYELLTTNSYSGFGMVVGIMNGKLTIAELYDGYSAKRSGIRSGDHILMIDSLHVLYDTTNIIRKFTRGPIGGKVSIALLRDGLQDTIRLTLVRESIKIQSLGYTGFVNDSIGYIHIQRFSSSTPDEVKRTVMSFRRKNPRLAGIILDVRDNPGGLLEAAVGVCDVFLPQNSPIVLTKGRTRDDERVYTSQSIPLEPEIPVSIIINSESASASEVLAGAFQDLDRGIIIGEQSYGKGLVQSILNLPGERALKLTTARYYTPSGRCIQKLISKSEISDSVTAEKDAVFYTKSGRIVKARHGIAPDTNVMSYDTHPIIKSLDEQNVFFRFASFYCSSLDSLPANWQVKESDFTKFIKWLSSQSTIIFPEPYSSLNQSIFIAQQNGYSKQYVQSIENMKTFAAKDIKKSLLKSKKEVLALLSEQILSRFLSAKKMGEFKVEKDMLLKKTAFLLSSGNYKQLLYPKKVINGSH
jgi:carboxyl-terminal processing protease